MIRFSTKSKKDEFVKRLTDLAMKMERVHDQGDTGMLYTTQSMVDDIRCAAFLIATMPIRPE